MNELPADGKEPGLTASGSEDGATEADEPAGFLPPAAPLEAPPLSPGEVGAARPAVTTPARDDPAVAPLRQRHSGAPGDDGDARADVVTLHTVVDRRLPGPPGSEPVPAPGRVDVEPRTGTGAHEPSDVAALRLWVTHTRDDVPGGSPSTRAPTLAPSADAPDGGGREAGAPAAGAGLDAGAADGPADRRSTRVHDGEGPRRHPMPDDELGGGRGDDGDDTGGGDDHHRGAR